MKQLIITLICTLCVLHVNATRTPELSSRPTPTTNAPSGTEDRFSPLLASPGESVSSTKPMSSPPGTTISEELQDTTTLKLTDRQTKKMKRLSKVLKKHQKAESSLTKKLLVAGLLISLIGLIFTLMGVVIFSYGLLIVGYTFLGIGSLLLLAAVLVPLLQNME